METKMKQHKNMLKNVMQPVARAKGLPNEFYVDEKTHEQEKQKLFFNNWAALAFAKDIPNNGDVKPITFLDMPLLLTRDNNGELRVFQNICRHRGMILVQQAKNIRGVIRCPYHSWCYSLQGDLKTTPHVGGPGHNIHKNIKRENLGLIEVRSHVWQDIIFINANGKAPDFAKANKTLLKRWREFEQPSVFGGKDSQFDLHIKCNWKLAVENYCESYHLPWVHPGLNSYSRLEDHYHIIEKGQFSGQGTLVYNPSLSKKQAFENYPNLSKKWDKSAEYISLFPNVLLGVHRDHRYAILLIPNGQGETTERVAIYYANKKMTNKNYAKLRQQNTKLWKDIFIEDIFVVEGMQAGRHAPQFDGGKFSPVMDEPTWIFHHWVAEKMAA